MLSSARHSLRSIKVLVPGSTALSLHVAGSPPFGLPGVVARHQRWNQLYHTTPSPRDAEPPPATTTDTTTDNSNAPPPIIWTTHRLSTEQIAKVDGIFHKVLWLDMFETATLIELINHRLGLVMTPKQRRALDKQMDARTTGISEGGLGQGDGSAEEVDQGPKLVDLKLTGFDAKSKIKVIKEVRAIAGLGLKEAKELVEAAPKIVQTGLSLEDGEALKAKMEEIGATVELV